VFHFYLNLFKKETSRQIIGSCPEPEKTLSKIIIYVVISGE